mmetsp:Transcript_8934/g.10093  ORF Transcript_8934/g.10093 Transcript_8934/m.10093 type:complete len:337 (-) Transcript_8934:764-1774(-)
MFESCKSFLRRFAWNIISNRYPSLFSRHSLGVLLQSFLKELLIGFTPVVSFLCFLLLFILFGFNDLLRLVFECAFAATCKRCLLRQLLCHLQHVLSGVLVAHINTDGLPAVLSATWVFIQRFSEKRILFPGPFLLLRLLFFPFYFIFLLSALKALFTLLLDFVEGLFDLNKPFFCICHLIDCCHERGDLLVLQLFGKIIDKELIILVMELLKLLLSEFFKLFNHRTTKLFLDLQLQLFLLFGLFNFTFLSVFLLLNFHLQPLPFLLSFLLFLKFLPFLLLFFLLKPLIFRSDSGVEFVRDSVEVIETGPFDLHELAPDLLVFDVHPAFLVLIRGFV